LELGGEASVTRIAIRIGVSDRPNLGLHNAGSHNSYSSHQPNNNNQTPHDDKKHKRKSSMGIGIRMSGSSALLSSVQQSGMNQVSNRQSMIVGTGDQNSFSWEVWDCVRNVCDYHPRLGLGKSKYLGSESEVMLILFRLSISALDMSNPLPPSLTTLQRWIAEPTDIIFLPSQSFIPNAKGYPVLSKACQAFIRSFVRVSAVVRSCPCLDETLTETINL
jgi:protein arginine N-methyltransferase 5